MYKKICNLIIYNNMKANVKSNNTNKIMEGLRRRPNYDELVSNINKPVIPLSQFPDRKAVKLRNSNWLSQLDGDAHKAIESMHLNMIKEQEKDRLLQNYSTSNNVPLSFTRAQAHAQTQHDVEAQRDDELFRDLLTPSPSVPPPAAPPPFANWVSPERPTQRNMTHEFDHMQLDELPQIPLRSQTQSFHHSNVPPPMVASKTRKVRKHITDKARVKFFDMAKDDLDDKVEQTHTMNVDDAEMNARDAEDKIRITMLELDAMFGGSETSTILSLLEPTYTQGGSSSSTAPKQGSKHHLEDTSKSSSPVLPRPKAKAKASDSSSPVHARPKAKAKTKHDDEPKTEKRESGHEAEKKESKSLPKAKVAATEKHKVVHGTQVETFTDFDGWKSKGRGFLVDQIGLRKIHLSKTEKVRMTKKDLIEKLLNYDKK